MDGYLYPWTFSVHDFEPITGRIHQPPRRRTSPSGLPHGPQPGPAEKSIGTHETHELA